MKPFKHRDCVEVVQCNVFEKNLIYGQDNSNCWEMARQTKDIRFMYNVCQDCIVYVFSKDEGALTKNEIKHILSRRKINCYSSEKSA